MSALFAGGHVVNHALHSVDSEIWKGVAGYPDYQVSSHGRVRSLDRRDAGGRRVPGKMLKPNANKAHGHSSVTVYRDGKRVQRFIHLLVLESFVDVRPPGMEACHNDGDGFNNRLENLRWDTRSANVLDQVRHGVHAMSLRERCPRGHLLADFNNTAAGIRKRNQRFCLACQRGTATARRSGEPLKQVSDRYYIAILEGAVGAAR